MERNREELEEDFQTLLKNLGGDEIGQEGKDKRKEIGVKLLRANLCLAEFFHFSKFFKQ